MGERRAARFYSGVSLAALIAGTSWLSSAFAAGTDANPAGAQDGNTIEEVVVTARKRSELEQSSPVTLQAFSQQKIAELNITDFEDYARFAPSISYNSSGPGQDTIVIRGVAASTGNRAGESPAALYLDEQPLTSNALMPDPRIVDVERIEVLPGPQGTLYGASSQSGTVRILTNKPNLDSFEGMAQVTGSTTEHGSGSYDINGMVNVPIVDDKLAIRISGFDSEYGGFIDNVPGTTPGGTHNNDAIAKDDVNLERQKGIRAAVRWEISSRVTFTGSYTFQDTDQHGPSSYDPAVGDLETVRFFKEFFKDDWQQFAATIDADLGFADLVATSAYYTRHIHNISDNTAYMQFLTHLAKSNPTYYSFYNFGPDPLGYYDFRLKEHRFTDEVRLSSKPGSRWNWIVGAFYQEMKEHTLANAHIINYEDTPSYASVAAYLSKPTDVYFHQQVVYDRSQVAFFGELSYDITDQLTATIGSRYFIASNDGEIDTQIPEGLPVEHSPLKAPQTGYTPKAELSYKINDDALVYALYSQGYRLGGANRDKPGLAVPLQYQPDKLTNYELGAKTEWFDNRLLVNLSAYWMHWDNFQLNIRNPNPATYYFVTANVGQAEIKGIELETEAHPIDHLTIGAAGTVLNSALSKPAPFLDNAPAGTRLPVTPELKYSLYVDYRFPLALIGAQGYVRADVSHTGDSTNNVDPTMAMVLPAYTTVNFQTGFDRDNFTLNLFANNLFDERAITFINPEVYDHTQTPIRPREIGITITQHF